MNSDLHLPELEILQSENRNLSLNKLKQSLEDSNKKENQQDNQDQRNIIKESFSQDKNQEKLVKAHTANSSSEANQNKENHLAKQKKMVWEIFEDYSCVLNLTDISYGIKGHNKFYQIQIFHRNNLYFKFFAKWGRVGAQNPQSSEIQYDSQYDAIVAFKKKFQDKTHQQWEDRDRFRPQPGKYTLIKIDQMDSAQSQETINQEIERLNKRNQILRQKISKIPSDLEKKIRNLMEMIWDIQKMNNTLKDLNFDTEKYPLGKLSSEQISKGFKILTEIQNVLLKGGKQAQIIDLTNQFYTNIPQNFGMRKLPLIDTLQALKDKSHLLEVLNEIDLANKFMNLTILSKENQINPLDQFYQMLNINLREIHQDEKEFKLIKEMITNTHGLTHNKYSLSIIDLFRLERKGEKMRFFPFKQMNNRQLLWHGSRITNFPGILSKGLRIAPSDAPSTGYMFGKGIYFSDVCSKSANYCMASPNNPEGLLILSEVALGNSYQVYKAKPFSKPPKFYHSILGVGRMRPDPKKKAMFEEDLVAHFGPTISNEELTNQNLESQLIYNEYVVYDIAQVLMKFIIRVKFNFLESQK